MCDVLTFRNKTVFYRKIKLTKLISGNRESNVTVYTFSTLPNISTMRTFRSIPRFWYIKLLKRTNPILSRFLLSPYIPTNFSIFAIPTLAQSSLIGTFIKISMLCTFKVFPDIPVRSVVPVFLNFFNVFNLFKSYFYLNLVCNDRLC